MSANPKKPRDQYKPKRGKYVIKDMIVKINEYIESHKNTIPILKECCFENGWNYDYFMQLQRSNADLADAASRLLSLKEIRLEQGIYTGQVNAAAGKFSLKQLGWSDRYVVDSNVASRSMSQEEAAAMATQRLEELRAARKEETEE